MVPLDPGESTHFPSRLRLAGSALVAALFFGAVAWTGLAPGWIRTLNRLAMVGSAQIQRLPDARFFLALPLPFGGVAVVAGILLVLAWCFLGRRTPRGLGAAICLLGGGTLLAEAIKACLPPAVGALGFSRGPAHGFPSGHATMALALGLVPLFLAPPRWRPWAASFGALLSATLNYSLLRARYHMPFEILGAVLLTLCLAFLLLALLPSRSGALSLPGSLPALLPGALGMVLLLAGIVQAAAVSTLEPGPFQAAAAYGAAWRLVVGSGLLAPGLVLLGMSGRAQAVLDSEG